MSFTKFSFALALACWIVVGCGGSSGTTGLQPEDFQIAVAQVGESTMDLKFRTMDGQSSSDIGTIPRSDYASISPNLSKLTYENSIASEPIKVTDLDGANPHTIGVANEFGRNPVLSPDGSKVAFETSITVNSIAEFYVAIANSDGSNQIMIAGPETPHYPQFTPDGR